MKKFLRIIPAALIIAAFLTACQEPAPSSVPSSSQPAASSSSVPTQPVTPSSSSVPPSSAPEHVCQSSGQWQFDLRSHWRLCDEHGEPTDRSAHAVADDRCTTCGVTFMDVSGWTVVNKFNAHNHLVLGLSYDEHGILIYKDVYEYTYNEEGTMLSSIYYENDILIQEFGWNEHGHQILEVYFNPDGSVQVAKRSEFTYDEQGRVTSQKNFVNDAPSTEWHNAYIGEERIITLQVYYDAEGNITAVHHAHDDDGNPTESTTYVNGVITVKYEYAVSSNPLDGAGVVTARKYQYNPDGSYTLYDYTVFANGYIVYTYDANGNLISQQYYDSKGNPIEAPADHDETL